MINPRVIGADRVARGLLTDAATVETRSRALERHHRQLLLMQIQAAAPRRTGAYAASWRIEGEEVGTDHPAGFRLENGFHGVDSLGRRYNQAPQPHVDPAVDRTETVFVSAEEAMVRSL